MGCDMLSIVSVDKFGERLTEIRKKNNISQRQLSADLGLGSTGVYYYESGKKTPSIEVLLKLSQYFHVSADYLLGLVDEPNAKGEVPRDYEEFKEKAEKYKKIMEMIEEIRKI